MMPLQEPVSVSYPFAPGADLWVVPDRHKSKWAQKIDWYLNFQIAKSAQHQSRNLQPEVLGILKACALDGYERVPETSDSLLILSCNSFPNRWILVLRGCEQLEAWVQTAVSKWKNLNSPSIRIFLPPQVTIAQFAKTWQKFGGSDEATFFEDGATFNRG